MVDLTSTSVTAEISCFILADPRPPPLVKGEMAAKTIYQRSAKGPLAIAECSLDGKCIIIENTGRKVSNQNFPLTLLV
jgi:hypothetical protein